MQEVENPSGSQIVTAAIVEEPKKKETAPAPSTSPPLKKEETDAFSE